MTRFWPESPMRQKACALLCELNVIEQVENVCQTTIVRDAWERGQKLIVHGLVYGLQDGLLHDLGVSTDSRAERPRIYEAAIAAVARRSNRES